MATIPLKISRNPFTFDQSTVTTSVYHLTPQPRWGKYGNDQCVSSDPFFCEMLRNLNFFGACAARLRYKMKCNGSQKHTLRMVSMSFNAEFY